MRLEIKLTKHVCSFWRQLALMRSLLIFTLTIDNTLRSCICERILVILLKTHKID